MNNPNGDKRIIEARNPRTGEMDYSFTATSKDEIETIANEIRSNQSAWAALHIDQRAEALKEWANIVANSQDLLDALVIDTGRYFIATSEVGRLSASIEASSLGLFKTHCFLNSSLGVSSKIKNLSNPSPPDKVSTP